MFIIQLHVYEFAYLLKFICNTQNNVRSTFLVIRGHAENSKKNLSYPTHMFPVEVKQGNTLPSCFSSHCKYMSSGSIFSAILFVNDLAI